MTSPDIGRWSVEVEAGRIYFLYRGSVIGQFSGLFQNAQFMVTCINAALAAYAPVADAVAREAGYESMSDWCDKDRARTVPEGGQR